MDKKEIADILDEIGTLLELRGENPFKSRAYHNASRIVGALTKDLEQIVETGELQDIKGIGKGLAETITELVRSGKSKYHHELQSSLPAGLLEMIRIQGLGPKRVKILYDKLNIKSVDQLQKAAQQHKLAALDGFGEKSEENILKGIETLSKHADQHLFPLAEEAATRILDALRKQKGVIRCEIAGSLRRRKEIIGDIDIVVSAKPADTAKIMRAFTSHPDVESLIGQGETKSSVMLKSGIHCDLRIVSETEFPFALAYFTGSKEHNIEMRSRAKQFGWSLNEYGFSELGADEKRGKAKRLIQCKTEEDIYRSLRLAYVPPELREHMGEIEAAADDAIPELIELNDLRGTFHCHTTYSDGANTLAEMAAAARELGWEYLGIADHSKIAAYAGGLSDEKVKQQLREIDKLNGGFNGFKFFKGTEVDILPDGSLDWNSGVLERFDYVVASIHSKFKMTEAEATRRTIKALKNKYVAMLGHPTGRLLLEREGYPVNMIEVIDAAADYGKMIEINAHPSRLDLDWRLCKYAKEKGVKVCINPDAHNIDGLKDVRYGVGIARKGWLERKDVVNTLSVKEVRKRFEVRG
jgi:DNA polymerase (family 10)